MAAKILYLRILWALRKWKSIILSEHALKWNGKKMVKVRASDRSRGKKSNFVGFLGSNSRKNRPISPEFRGKFQGKLRQKAMGKKRPILLLFSRQISLEIDRFCTDQTSVFNVFLTEVIICSFNNNTLKKWTNGKAFNFMASAQGSLATASGSFGTFFSRFSDEVSR